MIWQDVAITVIQSLLIVPLIPSLFQTKKPPFVVSLGTGVLLGMLAIVFATLSLWFATTSTGVVAVVWLVLAVQERKRNTLQKNEDKSGENESVADKDSE